MESDLFTKVLIHVNISAVGPKVLYDALIVIHDSNFKVMESFWGKLHDVKLSNFTDENIMTIAPFIWPSLSMWIMLDTSIPRASPMLHASGKRICHDFEIWVLKNILSAITVNCWMSLMYITWTLENICRVYWYQIMNDAHNEYKQLLNAGDLNPEKYDNIYFETEFTTTYNASSQLLLHTLASNIQ